MQTTMMDAPLSLNHLLERAGRLFPTREVVSRLPDKSLRRHSFGEIYRRTRALADALRQRGLRKGDCVATLSWNHHAHLECYFGIPAAGGVLLTLNLRQPPDDVAWVCSDAKAQFLIVDDVLLPLYQRFAHLHSFERIVVVPFSGAAVAADFEDYEALISQGNSADFTYEAHREDDPVAMCYTSGTTGRSKGVVYSHRSTILHALSGSLADFWGLRADDVVLPVTPMFHVNSWGIPYAALMVGSNLVFPGPHLHPDDLLDLIRLEPPTLSLGVPTIWMTLIQTYDAAQDPKSPNHGRWHLPIGMRSAVGGAAVPESLIRAFAKYGVRIMQGWGMTEASPVITISYPRPELRDADEDEHFRRAAMAGVPVPLIDVRLWGEHGEVPWDGVSVGEVHIRGPFVTRAYHGLVPDEEKFTRDGWLRTGDVATIDALGFVRITDRSKDLIKSGGEWISSVDMENALMAHPSVAEAAVIAIPSEKWSERPLACVVVKPGHELQPQALLEHLTAHRFAKWQLPERFEFIDAVPRTSTGKFWKVKLRERFPQ